MEMWFVKNIHTEFMIAEGGWSLFTVAPRNKSYWIASLRYHLLNGDVYPL